MTTIKVTTDPLLRPLRLFSGTDRDDTVAEGVCIAVSTGPQVCVETSDGRQKWWKADLTEATGEPLTDAELTAFRARQSLPAEIHPDDRAAVELLRDLVYKAFRAHNGFVPGVPPSAFGNALQTALREYAAPPTPIYREVDRPVRPWPNVRECQANPRAAEGHECPQCSWIHVHDWVAWTNPDRRQEGRGTPVRCSKCGARKCDREDCALRRHHHGDDHSPVQL